MFSFLKAVKNDNKMGRCFYTNFLMLHILRFITLEEKNPKVNLKDRK